MCSILTGLVATSIKVLVKIFLTLYVKVVHFSIYKLCTNKNDFLKKRVEKKIRVFKEEEESKNGKKNNIRRYC